MDLELPTLSDVPGFNYDWLKSACCYATLSRVKPSTTARTTPSGSGCRENSASTADGTVHALWFVVGVAAEKLGVSEQHAGAGYGGQVRRQS